MVPANGKDRIMKNTNTADVLAGYLKRLDDGEALESVQADFRKNFSDVRPKEIVEAEQALLKSGVSVTRVQKLCDIHSALFHGSTREERIAEAERAVGDDMEESVPVTSNKSDLTQVTGHPLYILTEENNILTEKLNNIRDIINDGADKDELAKAFSDLSAVNAHYDKKDELILPPLKRHGVRGPADVMWTVDGDIRKSIKEALTGIEKEGFSGETATHILALMTRMEEMVYKETNILYPMAAEKMTDEEWQGIYADMPRFGFSWLKDIPEWADAKEAEHEMNIVSEDGEDNSSALIRLPGGSFSLKQLEAVLRAMPLELTYIDERDTNRYFSEDGELFPRAASALNHKVDECHPPKVIPIVQNVIGMLKSGEKDVVAFTTTKKGRKAYVRYIAVRGRDGEYLGTLEAVEDITDI